ncbi:hypothetical protein OEA41_009062 [Lepraria neglecta]|uniref:Uncharacterized protein n=1 Tax=Lepraria neglecta TaxID=209136 RepID=A0AAE0DJV5_9LECA|nr:hypothetical protein OEA41_009062 [Lepraria neglecta]
MKALRLLEDLTNEEQAMFDKVSIEAVLYDASAAEKKHGVCSKSRALSKKFEPLVSAIDQYGEAIDVYANAYPLALSPLWASIRIVLHLDNLDAKMEIDERRQLLKGLSTVDYTAKHHKIQNARYEGTGDWVFESEAHLAWEKSEASENICSAIAACLRICIIVDDLDECKKAARRDVIALLEYLLTLEITIIKVLVSSREDDQSLTSLDAYPRIQLSESMLAADIEAIITESVGSKIHDRELKVNDPTLEHEIVSELVTKAHGMFLWVFFQLEELCDAPSDTSVREILREFPKGVAATYGRILGRLGKAKNKIPSKVFKWVA